MRNIKLWPHGALIALACALVAGVGVALYSRYGQNSQAAALPDAARIQRVDGQVAFNDNLTDDNSNWTAAAPNQPFSVGDRIYTRENSRTSLALAGETSLAGSNTSLTGESATPQLALRKGRRFSMSVSAFRRSLGGWEHRLARSNFRSRVFTK